MYTLYMCNCIIYNVKLNNHYIYIFFCRLFKFLSDMHAALSTLSLFLILLHHIEVFYICFSNFPLITSVNCYILLKINEVFIQCVLISFPYPNSSLFHPCPLSRRSTTFLSLIRKEQASKR